MTMPKYRATFTTHITLTVEVEGADEEHAGDVAWDIAEEYLKTIGGNYRNVRAEATLDGIGADEVEEIEYGDPFTPADLGQFDPETATDEERRAGGLS